MHNRKPFWGLVALTAFVVAGYYWIAPPSEIARRFVKAVNSQNFDAAEQLFIDPQNRFLTRLSNECWRFIAQARLAPWSIRQLISSERHVLANLQYSRVGLSTHYEFVIAANRTGLQEAQIQSFGGDYQPDPLHAPSFREPQAQSFIGGGTILAGP